MNIQSRKQGIVWGGLLILVGAALLIETTVELSAWVWVALLAAGGLGAYAVYATDRTDKWLLLASYILLVIAAMIALITLDVLRDGFVATYVLAAISLPFIVSYLQGDKTHWWKLIPPYVLLAIAVMIPLDESGALGGEFIATYVLSFIAIPFIVVFVRDRKQWWALIPAYVLLAIAVMVPLLEAGALSGNLVPVYVFVMIAVPFFVVYARDTTLWWALVPGGIMVAMAFAFLIAEGVGEFVIPALLVVAGVWVLVRQLTRKEG